ncbi:MAG: IPT/TIG domain-containing protein [Chloroflexi bacterium]|nr:IPT/TIG domain-containing protein [Chloroflexota bacterium]
MKKRLLVTMGIILTLFVGSGMNTDISASARSVAADVIPPTVAGIDPSSAFNDLSTPVVITGTRFTFELSEELTPIPPTAYLGNTALLDITWVDSNTLTATVPWGIDPGLYTLTVVNPDGGTASLADAFTVKTGIGQWNGGDLFGGQGFQVLMKPGDSNTLYTLAYEVGLFRSRDAGENWTFVNGNVIGNIDFVIDPLHPSWLYSYAYNGLYRSLNEGDTWSRLMISWPDGRSVVRGQVYPSLHNSSVLFVRSTIEPGNPPTGALGLIKSTNSGTSWQIVTDMEGIPVQDVDFHPTDPLRMVLGTQDGRVFQSADGGNHWNEVNKPPVTFVGSITYNPYNPNEVWITIGGDAGIYKSTDANFTSWENVTPNNYQIVDSVDFASATSVYLAIHWGGGYHSSNSGSSWESFGPATGGYDIAFSQSDPNVIYMGDIQYGVQKSINGGQNWEIKNQGLSGMRASSIEASQEDPRRVYAIFDRPGIFRSDDGAYNWRYLPIDGSWNVRRVREDPFDPQRIYVAADAGFYLSTNEGASWSDSGWNLGPSGDSGMPYAMAVDPYQPGHLLVGFRYGSDGFHTSDTGRLYSSRDYGASWQPVTVAQDLAWIWEIVFHPEVSGLVYLSTDGTGVYRSADSGDTWERVDDLQQSGMQNAGHMAIATHPQRVLVVGGNNLYRSLDGGETWLSAHCPPTGGVSAYMFLDGDSTRLYAATFFGLFYSSNLGTSWTRAAGSIGWLNVSQLDYSVGDNYSILYAATSGGRTGGITGMAANASLESLATGSELVEAGIYRYVKQQNVPKLPGVPFLVAPANGALTTDYTPRLDWNTAASADHYQLQVSTSNTFATIVMDKPNVTLSEFTPTSDLTPNSRYYWRVRTYNPLGKVSVWSVVRSFRTALPPPSLLAPDDSTDQLTKRPSFDWSDIDGATGYALQIAKNNGSSIIGTYSSITSNYTPIKDLPANMTLHWRVHSKGVNGPSIWTEWRSFDTPNPPSTPTLVSPVNNALTTDYTPKLDWSNSTVPTGSPLFDHYLLQVGTIPDFSDATDIPVSGLANSQYEFLSDLLPNTKYYWRVSSYNENGEYSAWSTVRYFRTTLPAPDSLSADVTIQNLRPVFAWNMPAYPLPAVTSYTVQISRNSTFTQIVQTGSSKIMSYVPAKDLPRGLTLFWHVRANGVNGPGAWSDYGTFSTGNPPGIPALLTPASNALVTTYTPTLDWGQPNLMGGIFKSYRVEIAADPAFLSISRSAVVDVLESHLWVTDPALGPNTKYYWHVQACNTSDECGTWSVARTFRTLISPPILFGPADGSIVTNRKPTFDWDDAFGATGYTIQVSKNEDFTLLVGTYNVTVSTYTPAVNLPVGMLYWRVRARGLNGPSLWSTPWTVIEE